MTISKGSALTIAAGTGVARIALFSSAQAGIVYRKPSVGSTLSGFLLDISSTTITKAGSQADLHVVSNSPIQTSALCPVDSSSLRAITYDDSEVVEVIPVTKTATELVGGTPYTMSWPAALISGLALPMGAYNWDSDTLVVALRSNTSPITWYLSLTNDTTQGNVVQFSPATAPTSRCPTFAPFSTTSGILVYQEQSTLNMMGVVLTKSGLTLSAGTPFTIDSNNASSAGGCYGACFISGSLVGTGQCDSAGDRRLTTITSPNTPNSTTTIAASDFVMCLERFHEGSILAFTDDQAGTSYWSELTNSSGTLTHTNTVSESGDTNGGARNALGRIDNSRIIGCFGDSGTTKAIIISTDVSPPGILDDEFTAAPMVSKPCDIDADGDFIYIGALASDGTPVLIKFSTALNADGSVVFEPGSGDNIGVECSRVDADEVTIAGQFDGTNVVERSEDAGVLFSVIDDATIGGISAFKVGPDSDDRILVFDEDNSDLLETIDAGDNWTTINASVSQAIKAIGRLGVDVQQVVFGNSSADAATVTHSMSSGADIEELTGGDDPNSVDISGIIIN